MNEIGSVTDSRATTLMKSWKLLTHGFINDDRTLRLHEGTTHWKLSEHVFVYLKYIWNI